MAQADANEWRFSKLKGLNVYNNNNEKLGDIDDLLVDKSGQIKAAIVSVGGFLGIGDHLVAVPFSQLQFVHDNNNTAGRAGPNTAATAPGTTAADNTAGRNNAGSPSTTGTAATGLGSPATTTGNNANTAASTGTAGTPVAANNAAAMNDRRRNDTPDRAVLNATKDQLKAAPQFKWNG